MQVAVALFSALCLTVASTECFRVLQSTGYRPQRGYFKIYLTIYYLCLFTAQLVSILLYVYFAYYYYVNLALYALLAVVVCVVKRKCPLKLTKRIWRMIVAQAAVLSVLSTLFDSSFFVWLLPLITLVSWVICLPIDAAVAGYYLRRARNKLDESGVNVIAITGSYGKTSVKDMLSALLCDSISPSGSCNTPLGIAAYINRTDLSRAKYLILEFGARRRGDIAELCKLFKPKYGIVTGVCAQHLSTFKSLDNVVATKRELVEHIPQDGFCVLNYADEIVASFVNVGKCAKYLSCDGVTVAVKGVGLDGTRLEIGYMGEKNSVSLPQITDYVKDSFAMCLQMALRLNQSLDCTLGRMSLVTQTPHRMELIRGANCYIIDDSYNGSIVGVASCVRTLAQFDVTKVVITQGLVECGKERKQMNVQCGRLLGDVCDVAVTLGRNAKYLAEGLKQNCKTLYAKNLKQAVALATQYVNGGILLFQNDLPDTVNL